MHHSLVIGCECGHLRNGCDHLQALCSQPGQGGSAGIKNGQAALSHNAASQQSRQRSVSGGSSSSAQQEVTCWQQGKETQQRQPGAPDTCPTTMFSPSNEGTGPGPVVISSDRLRYLGSNRKKSSSSFSAAGVEGLH